MSAAFTDPRSITCYHAHVYYDAETRPVAERLREGIGAGFQTQLGRWHDNPIGPHPVSMYQVAFPIAEFTRLVPWLMLNRSGLTVLVHPLTGDDYEDHATFPLWLGSPLPLKLGFLKRRGEVA
jgi:aromatic ring-cleaving dioxygenase